MGLFNIFRLTTRIAALEDRVERVERDQKGLETEWSSVYDSVRRTLAKIARRDQREAETRQEPAGPAIVRGPDQDLNEQIRRSRRGIS